MLSSDMAVLQGPPKQKLLGRDTICEILHAAASGSRRVCILLSQRNSEAPKRQIQHEEMELPNCN